MDFTPLAQRLPPAEMVGILDQLFSEFDVLVERHGLEKIKTIGDCYMAAAGVPNPRPDHARRAALLALEMRDVLATSAVAGQPGLELRIGINSGPVVAGVIGKKRFLYDLWGDAVNTASRMESHGTPGEIQITRATYELLKDEFVCRPTGNDSRQGQGPDGDLVPHRVAVASGGRPGCVGQDHAVLEQADGALLGIDFDLGAVGDAGGGSVGADHRCKTELARHDRGVAQRSAFFHHEGADHGQQRVHRRSGERRDQHIARLELIEGEHQVAHHARPPAVGGVADADPAHGGWFVVCGGGGVASAPRLAMIAAVARAIAFGSASSGGGASGSPSSRGGGVASMRSRSAARSASSSADGPSALAGHDKQHAVELVGEQLDDVRNLVHASGRVQASPGFQQGAPHQSARPVPAQAADVFALAMSIHSVVKPRMSEKSTVMWRRAPPSAASDGFATS